MQGVLEPGAATDLHLKAHISGGVDSTAEVLASGALRLSRFMCAQKASLSCNAAKQQVPSCPVRAAKTGFLMCTANGLRAGVAQEQFKRGNPVRPPS